MRAAGRDPRHLGARRRDARAGSARSSSCTSSRAAAWSTRTRRSASARRSGRTGGGGSTSAARPTTPARPGWPTGDDPMLDLRPRRAGRPDAPPSATAALATVGKVRVEPNGVNAIPSQVDGLAGRPRRRRGRRAARGRRACRGRRRRAAGWSRSPGPADDRFDAGAARRGCRDCARRDAPVLADRGRTRRRDPRRAGIPTAMLFVRNPTGVSHSPAEHAERRLRGRASTRWPRVLEDGWPRDARYWCEHAWLRTAPVDRAVRIVVDDGRITAVEHGARPRPGDDRLPGWSLPGLRQRPPPRLPPGAARPHPATAAARSGPGASGCTPSPAGSTPTRYLALARAVYAEMALAGITAVGEFHYLHHAPDGTPYADPNAMGEALIAAAAEAGIRITLLDTCYLAGGLGATAPAARRRPAAVLRRRRATPGRRRVAAACPERPSAADRRGDPLGARRARRPAADGRRGRRAARPLHVHLSEQPAENEACSRRYGCTPDRLLAEPARSARAPPRCTPPTSPTTTSRCSAATRHGRLHVPDHRARPRRRHRPGPRAARRRVAAVPGQRQHAVIDLFEEARAMELRRAAATGERGHFTPAELSRAATAAGHARPRLARRRPDSRPGRAPTWSPSGSTPPRTAGAAPRPRRRVRRVGRRRATRGRRRPGRRRATGQHVLGDVGATAGRRRSRTLREDAMSSAGHRHRRAGHQRPLARRAARRRRDAALVVEGGRVAWVGPDGEAPAADRRIDVGGRAVIPASSTATPTWSSPATGPQEFAARMAGRPYDGGGIATTVAATRAASDDELRGRLRPAGRRDARARARRPSRSRAATG